MFLSKEGDRMKFDLQFASHEARYCSSVSDVSSIACTHMWMCTMFSLVLVFLHMHVHITHTHMQAAAFYLSVRPNN